MVEQAAFAALDISTHTLTWSVTFKACCLFFDRLYFNSHAHVERDGLNGQLPYIKIISTHTLTWSVTCKLNKLRDLRAYFNSHAHVERDGRVNTMNDTKLISTHTLTWSVTLLLYFYLA